MKRILKWIGIIFTTLLGLVLIAGIILFLLGQTKMDTVYTVTHVLDEATVEPAPEGRGEFLATAMSRCNGCHGFNFEGLLFVDNAFIGTIVAPNITRGRGGIADEYSVADWEQAIRHGLNRSGQAMVIMPAQYLTSYRDDDLHALITYLQSIPPIDNDLPETSLGPLMQMFIGTGLFKLPAAIIDHNAPHTARRVSEATVEYGKYLANIATCGQCHGAAFAGPDHSGPPPGPDLTSAGSLGSWSQSDFIKTIRTGTTPDNRVLNPVQMPWPGYSRMSDQELEAIWLYLESLP